MIELRWLVRVEKEPVIGTVGFNELRRHVLQYRTGYPSQYVGEPDIIWSDWTDVPTVREGER